MITPDSSAEEIAANVVEMEADKVMAEEFWRGISPEVMEFLSVWFEESFGINECCFRKSGGRYEAIDAVRRDAHREVFLSFKSAWDMAQRGLGV